MQLLQVNGQLTMSSLELVNYINEERGDGVPQLAHSDFLKKVKDVLGLDAGKYSSVYLGGNGQERPCYNFPKREACLMAMSYSYELQAKVFDRWYELETKQNQPAFKVPQTLSEALRLAADQQDTIVAQAAQLALAAPSVAYVENFVKCDGLIGIREAAKSLGLQQNAFVQMLVAAKIMFRENGHLQAYAADIEAKRFAVKVTKDLSGKARSQTMLTAKGIRWVANKLELDKLFAND